MGLEGRTAAGVRCRRGGGVFLPTSPRVVCTSVRRRIAISLIVAAVAGAVSPNAAAEDQGRDIDAGVYAEPSPELASPERSIEFIRRLVLRDNGVLPSDGEILRGVQLGALPDCVAAGAARANVPPNECPPALDAGVARLAGLANPAERRRPQPAPAVAGAFVLGVAGLAAGAVGLTRARRRRDGRHEL